VFAPKHLFVPVDADVTGDRALAESLVDVAGDLASLLDAKVTLAHIALPVSQPTVPSMDAHGEAYRAMLDVLEARNAAAARTLGELKARVVARGRPCETSLITVAGNVPELIVSSATNAGADLILLATHGRRGVKRVVLGSVAERVAHLTPMPVMLIPPKH
jgi:nucleotide-binding universal stress UspA family protein